MTMTRFAYGSVASLLVLALAACGGDGSPATADDAVDDAPEATMPPAPVADAPATAPPLADIDAGDPPASGSGLARFDGYGALRFGMTGTQLRDAWTGELKGIPAEGEGCHHLSPAEVRVPADLAFMVENDAFVRYSTEDAALVAPGGGRIGMTLDEIRALYPTLEAGPHKYVPKGQYLRIPTGEGNTVLIFETGADGKVEEWRVGVPPQIDYVEGCS